MSRGTLIPAATTLAMAAASAIAVSAQAHGARTVPTPHAHAAHTLKATDTAHLRYVSASGSLLYEEGQAKGALPGRMRVHFDLGAVFKGSFTIYLKGGAIRGRGSATPHGEGVYESFAGSLVVTGGTGRYARAHGKGAMYGTFNRNTYGLVIQTTGTLVY